MGAGSDDRVIYRVKVSKSGPISIDDLRALVDVLSDAEQRD
jgi:hypothetical protein